MTSDNTVEDLTRPTGARAILLFWRRLGAGAHQLCYRYSDQCLPAGSYIAGIIPNMLQPERLICPDHFILDSSGKPTDEAKQVIDRAMNAQLSPDLQR